jgi:hypothetical protein
MPKRITKMERLSRELKREFSRSGRNIEHFAARLGVNEYTANALINNVEAGVNPVKSYYWVNKILERTSKPVAEYYKGDKEAQEVYRKEGKDYLIRDFEIAPGVALPQDVLDEAERSYQIIVKDFEGNYYSTHAAQSFSSSLMEYETLVRSYSGLEVETVTVRTFTIT